MAEISYELAFELGRIVYLEGYLGSEEIMEFIYELLLCAKAQGYR